MNKFFRSSSEWTKTVFGNRVQKVPIDGGFSCPNRDGKLSKEGCLYCNNKTFTPFYTDEKISITNQLRTGTEFFSRRYNCEHFFAYFQTYSGTYAPIEILKKKYNEAIEFPRIKGIIISTRPDCIDMSVINLLSKLKEKTYIRIEVGVESFDDNVLNSINRCHDSETTIKAIKLLSDANIDTSVHLIFGLPNESIKAAKNYARILSNTNAKFVKLHHLQIVKGSRLAEIYANDNYFVKLYNLNSYIETLAEFLSYLRNDIYVERFINRVPKEMLIAPKFGDINENKFTQMLCDYMSKNSLLQGSLL